MAPPAECYFHCSSVISGAAGISRISWVRLILSQISADTGLSSLFISLMKNISNTAKWLLFLIPHPKYKLISSHLFVMTSFTSWPHLANQCVVAPWHPARSGISCVWQIIQLSFSVTYRSVTPLSSQWTLLGLPLMTLMSPFHMWGCIDCYRTGMWLRPSDSSEDGRCGVLSAAHVRMLPKSFFSVSWMDWRGGR